MKRWFLTLLLVTCIFSSVLLGQDSINDWVTAEAGKYGFQSITLVTTYKDSALKGKSEQLYIDLNKKSLVKNASLTVLEEFTNADTLLKYDRHTQLLHQFVYDSSQQSISKSIFLEDKLISQKHDYFDAAGRLIRSFEKMPYLEKESLWEFDHYGRKKAFKQHIKNTFEGQTSQAWEQYHYTADGRLWKVYLLDEKGRPIGHIHYLYHSNGFLKAAHRYHANELFAQTQYFYK